MDEEKQQKKKSPLWAFVSAALAALGFFFRFALRGYVYWGYLCFFVIFLILAHRFLPAVLWKIILVLTCIGFVYFWIVEIPIIRNARTDPEPERPYLVVLGAAVYGERPSLTLVRRMEGALDYLETYPESTAIVSGGGTTHEWWSDIYPYLLGIPAGAAFVAKFTQNYDREGNPIPKPLPEADKPNAVNYSDIETQQPGDEPQQHEIEAYNDD